MAPDSISKLLEPYSLRFNLPISPTICYLCGNLQISSSPWRNRRAWHFKARAVKGYNNGTVILSESGWTGIGGVDLEEGAPWTSISLEHTSDASAFGFHDACWSLLLKQVASVSAKEPHATDVAEHLFRLFRCLPANGRLVPIPAHDYGGASLLWSRKDPLDEHLRYLITDPIPVGSFPLLPKSAQPLQDSMIRANDLATECFAKIPEELVFIITGYLHIRDIRNVRLASRTFARLAVPAALPPSFWSSRFAPDREMGFLGYDKVPEDGQYCRNTYFHVVQGLLDSTYTDSDRNKVRIWHCLWQHTDCLISLLEQHGRLGSTATTQSWKEHVQDHDIQQVVSGNECQDSWDPEFHDAIGFCLHRVADFRFNLSDNRNFEVKVGISFITFNCTRYLCGLRLLSGPLGSLVNVEADRVCLILPNTETTLCLGRGNTISAVQVATAVDGVVGISFCLNDNDDCFLSAGTTKDLPVGVGNATMRPSSCRRYVAGLVLGFDASQYSVINLRKEQLTFAT